MQIKMLETSLGATDGVNIRSYEEGETYDVSQVLAAAFLGDGVAEPVSNEPAPKPKAKAKAKEKTSSKDAGAAPENKAG